MTKDEGTAEKVLEALEGYQHQLNESYKTPEEYEESMAHYNSSHNFEDRIVSIKKLYELYPEKDPSRLTKMAAEQRRYVKVGTALEETSKKTAKALGM